MHESEECTRQKGIKPFRVLCAIDRASRPYSKSVGCISRCQCKDRFQALFAEMASSRFHLNDDAIRFVNPANDKHASLIFIHCLTYFHTAVSLSSLSAPQTKRHEGTDSALQYSFYCNRLMDNVFMCRSLTKSTKPRAKVVSFIPLSISRQRLPR